MLPADDVGVELVAGSLAMLTRQASLMKLHDLVSARGGLTLERSTYPLLNQILALQSPGGGGRLADGAPGRRVLAPTGSRQLRQLEEPGRGVARAQRQGGPATPRRAPSARPCSRPSSTPGWPGSPSPKAPAGSACRRACSGSSTGRSTPPGPRRPTPPATSSAWGWPRRRSPSTALPSSGPAI